MALRVGYLEGAVGFGTFFLLLWQPGGCFYDLHCPLRGLHQSIGSKTDTGHCRNEVQQHFYYWHCLRWFATQVGSTGWVACTQHCSGVHTNWLSLPHCFQLHSHYGLGYISELREKGFVVCFFGFIYFWWLPIHAILYYIFSMVDHKLWALPAYDPLAVQCRPTGSATDCPDHCPLPESQHYSESSSTPLEMNFVFDFI